MYDLIILGSGPAGSSAAITAARLGARVLMLDKGRFPRQKVCGEFVSSESLALLASLLPDSPVLSKALRIDSARTFAAGPPVEFAVDPPAASVTRFDLDYALWQAAQSAGADVRQQTTAAAILGSGTLSAKSD